MNKSHAMLQLLAMSGFAAAASESSDPTAGGGEVAKVEEVKYFDPAAKAQVEGDDWELPTQGEGGKACSLNDPGCEACQ